jgi:hypothetical protein
VIEGSVVVVGREQVQLSAGQVAPGGVFSTTITKFSSRTVGLLPLNLIQGRQVLEPLGAGGVPRGRPQVVIDHGCVDLAEQGHGGRAEVEGRAVEQRSGLILDEHAALSNATSIFRNRDKLIARWGYLEPKFDW